jgi:hypothetical protein
MAEPTPRFDVLPRDLSPYRRGNTGIDYVHRFESGRPGPHVLVNALTHGNEFCGMVAATHLLDSGVRPLIGTLTVSFANVAAYESFDPARPLDSRQLVHNLNRIWSSAWLDGAEDSPELRRARELRPAVAAADHILDIHSTNARLGHSRFPARFNDLLDAAPPGLDLTRAEERIGDVRIERPRRVHLQQRLQGPPLGQLARVPDAKPVVIDTNLGTCSPSGSTRSSIATAPRRWPSAGPRCTW